MEIRRVRPDEWQALRDLRLRALATNSDAFGSTLAGSSTRTDAEWQERANPSDGAVFVAASQDRLVGMVIGGQAPHRPDAAAVYAMWVAPEARGSGVGAALMDAVESWAREAGYENIGLGVTTVNAPAVGLYSSRGYADTGERHRLREDTDLEDQETMAKRL